MVGLATVILSAASLGLSSRFSSLSWTARLVLLFGPAADAIVGLYVLSWFGLSPVNAVMGGILVGILSLTFIQPFFMPQRLVVWRLAKENIRRRKRQSVLMVAGLIIASAIITSSLVVGDSLDATVAYEVEASYGATDVLISGLDPQTGAGVQFSSDVADSVWKGIQQDNILSTQVIGRQYGLANGVSLTSGEGLAEPSVSWFARNASVDALQVWQPEDELIDNLIAIMGQNFVPKLKGLDAISNSKDLNTDMIRDTFLYKEWKEKPDLKSINTNNSSAPNWAKELKHNERRK